MSRGVGEAADQVSLRCPICESRASVVTDSRSHRGVRFRQRTCRGCGGKFTTAEQVIDVSIYEAICLNADFKVIDDRAT